jgi:hypothetical protein
MGSDLLFSTLALYRQRKAKIRRRVTLYRREATSRRRYLPDASSSILRCGYCPPPGVQGTISMQ